MTHYRMGLCAAIAATALATSPNLFATHSWGGYHWARTTDDFPLTVIDSTTPDWGSYVDQALGDWSQSQRLDMVGVAGDTSNKTRRRCDGGTGTVRICNLAYGNTGWLGIAGISLDNQGHITTGYTKLNDTYFNSGYYDNYNWRQAVTCQELGHNIGLDHQDENFTNTPLESCMDYQDPPWPSPNQHDYDELDTVYAHLDSYNSYAGGTNGGGGGGGGGSNGCNAPPGKGCNKSGANGEIGWGLSLGRRGSHETFVRIEPDGTTHFTFVTWAVGH